MASSDRRGRRCRVVQFRWGNLVCGICTTNGLSTSVGCQHGCRGLRGIYDEPGASRGTLDRLRPPSRCRRWSERLAVDSTAGGGRRPGLSQRHRPHPARFDRERREGAQREEAEKYDPSAPNWRERLVARPAFERRAQLIHQMPNLDVAVIELDPAGRPRAAADALAARGTPKGVSVPLNHDLSTDQVRWRWWDDNEWDVNGGQGTRDVVPGRENAPIDFTSPFPASVLKLMVGFGVLRLADQGRLCLADRYAYQPNPVRPACGEATNKPVRQLFDEMITVSKNESTCALIKMIHDLQAMDQLNQTFVDLGLGTLRLADTSPQNGGYWLGANMSAIDTAKLLLLINGGPGTLWNTASGQPVTRDVLSAASRAFF